MGCGASTSHSKPWGVVRKTYETGGIVIDKKARSLADKADCKLRRGSRAIKERLELHVICIQKYIVKINLSMSENVPRCNKGHDLLPDKILTSWQCNYCKRTLGQKPYMCSKCNYYLCSICYCWEGDMKLSLIQYIKCPKNHRIHITSIDSMIEFYISFAERYGVECVGCKKFYSSPFKKMNFYHCRQCRFDLCQQCVMKLNYIYLQEKTKCMHGAILEWSESDFGEYTCSKCLGFYEGIPKFKSESCECKFCINCSYNLIS